MTFPKITPGSTSTSAVTRSLVRGIITRPHHHPLHALQQLTPMSSGGSNASGHSGTPVHLRPTGIAAQGSPVRSPSPAPSTATIQRIIQANTIDVDALFNGSIKEELAEMAKTTLAEIAKGEDTAHKICAEDYQALKTMAAWCYQGTSPLGLQTRGTKLAMAYYLKGSKFEDVAEWMGECAGKEDDRIPIKEEEDKEKQREETPYRPTTPSDDGNQSNSPIADVQTMPFDHPGQGFFLFEPPNPLHYGVINRKTRQYCKYVRYNFTGPDPVVQGCDGPGEELHQTRIIAKPDREDPNFENDQKPMDDDLAIFFPWHKGRSDID